MTVVAIPSEDDKCLASKVAEHFRSSPYFTIVDIDGMRIQHCQAVKNSEITSPVTLFRSLGVNVALVDRIGSGQLQLLKKIGVSVLNGASADVEFTLAQYLDGKLSLVDNAPSCSGHCAD
jgi:predicted Fe-Mo cluster-binding NifX family protein